jgi:hypothetical protein
VIGLACAVALAPASAAAPLPVGEAKGVRAERQGGELVVIFTPRAAHLYRRVAGRLVSVICTDLPRPDEQGLVSVDSGGATFRAPKRRRPLRTGDRTRGVDYCDVSVRPRGRGRRPQDAIVSIPLTQDGAVYLDERSKTVLLALALAAAAIVMDRQHTNDYPTVAEMLERPRLTRRIGLVGLTTPEDTPPARKVGYYSNGRDHLAVVVVSASGRRLFLESRPDDVLYTNVARYLLGDL